MLNVCVCVPPCLLCQERVDSMARAYQPKRHTLALLPSVGMADLLAAREDICNLVKTSSGSSREGTACAVNKVELLSEHLVRTSHPGDSLLAWRWGMWSG